MEVVFPTKEGFCRSLLITTRLMCQRTIIGIINKKTLFDTLRATYFGRSIAALWKTAAVEQLFKDEHLLMVVVFPTKEGSAGFAATNKFVRLTLGE